MFIIFVFNGQTKRDLAKIKAHSQDGRAEKGNSLAGQKEARVAIRRKTGLERDEGSKDQET